MEFDYSEEIEKIYEHIGKSKTMALATSCQNHPTVRLVSYIINDKKILFQTGNDLMKYKQICENNEVGLCVDNIQIEGIANIIGKTNDKQKHITEIMEIYKKYHLNSYKTYSNIDKEVLIEIIPVKIIKWDYENGKPYRIFISINDKTVKKEMYL
ncbi:MAG: pyridoxamine 5'-phosphate oxidase family protein [Spirochaetaceae bacterium]|nr:pyridoxamine 5'-phosphate oxidase family protein [Spirochaetaceae bacterium]